MDKNVQTTKEQGMIRTLFGRLRRVNEINSPNYQLRQFGERVAMNMPLQGSASDIIKLAMIVVHNKLKEKNLKSKLILQIHDELIIDAAPDELEQVKALLKQSMENVVKLDVDLPVEVSVGKTWFDCK
jgi:DNA polymerase-1